MSYKTDVAKKTVPKTTAVNGATVKTSTKTAAAKMKASEVKAKKSTNAKMAETEPEINGHVEKSREEVPAIASPPPSGKHSPITKEYS